MSDKLQIQLILKFEAYFSYLVRHLYYTLRFGKEMPNPRNISETFIDKHFYFSYKFSLKYKDIIINCNSFPKYAKHFLIIMLKLSIH
jgi:hypothetical protein